MWLSLSPATNSCHHFSRSATIRPDCFLSCHVTPVIRNPLTDWEEEGNDCLCDCLSPNNTNNPPSSDFLLTHCPSTFLTSFSQTQQNSSSLFVFMTPSCVCMFVVFASVFCVFMLSLQMHTEKMLCVSVCGRTGFTPCCVCETLKLSLGNESWSLIWLLFFPLTPPFYSDSNAPRKMQLVCELIPPPAEL